MFLQSSLGILCAFTTSRSHSCSFRKQSQGGKVTLRTGPRSLHDRCPTQNQRVKRLNLSRLRAKPLCPPSNLEALRLWLSDARTEKILLGGHWRTYRIWDTPGFYFSIFDCAGRSLCSLGFYQGSTSSVSSPDELALPCSASSSLHCTFSSVWVAEGWFGP
ncbi:hypothetical protein VTI28DRAFT_7393 [Corynascus sepedonium]